MFLRAALPWVAGDQRYRIWFESTRPSCSRETVGRIFGELVLE